MPYVTFAEYDAYRPGQLSDDNEFAILSEAASAIIDRMTLSKIIHLGGLSVFSAFTQDRIKKATMAQIDTLDAQGGLDALTGFPAATAGSVKIGRYSESTANQSGAGKGIQLIDGMPVSPLVRTYLQSTNLLNRAINRTWTLADIT